MTISANEFILIDIHSFCKTSDFLINHPCNYAFVNVHIYSLAFFNILGLKESMHFLLLNQSTIVRLEVNY